MTKRFFATLRYTTVVALVASVFVFSGCGDDDKGPTVYDGTILDFLKSDQFKQSLNGGDADNSFDSLVMYLDKFPDLEANLTGTTDITLFAPSNKAFVNLTALPGLKDPDQINQDIIKGVLAYHFAAGKKMKADMTAGSTVTTFYKASDSAPAEVITINGDGTLLTGSQNNAIQITTADQLAKNGVVHTTATVLIPPSTGSQLSAILGSLGATVLLGKDFTYMAYMITSADAGVTNPLETFTGKIAKGTDLTLLAIPNAVFVGAFNAQNSLPPTNVPTVAQVRAYITAAFGSGASSVGRKVLNNHLIVGRYTVAAGSGSVIQFATGTLSNTASGKQLTITTGVSAANCSCLTGVVITGTNSVGGGTSKAPIVKADIDTEAGISNGVLQVVGGIILP